MKQVLIRRGKVTTEEVPAPTVRPGTVCVAVGFSAISTGTETAGLSAAAVPLWKQALRDPSKIRKAWRRIRKTGFAATARTIQAARDSAQATGYSCAGVVTAVGEGVDDLAVGDRVACAGAQYAHHAEVVCVPRNLVARVPDGCTLEQAATTTLGAIAMQGVRRANCALGEIAVVVGLGGLGQIIVQMLAAAGARVAAIDLDPRRVELAKTLGAEWGIVPQQATDDAPGIDSVQEVLTVTDGAGADVVLIAAATKSDQPMLDAMQMARRKGKVVIVGDVGLKLQREPFYVRELDVLISTSYGPGRYDVSYEEEGLDYPYAYVRWTENRNMAEYLRLVAAGTVKLDDMIESVRPIGEAADAFAALQGAGPRPLLALLQYDTEAAKSAAAVHTVPLKPTGSGGPVKLGVIGAGAFAKSMLLPALRDASDVEIVTLMARRGHAAQDTARQFGAGRAGTEVSEVLGAADVNAVLIATRHDSHAGLIAQAAEAGKAIWCEKPVAMTEEGLAKAIAAVRKANVPLMIGFNRPFAPHLQQLRASLADRHGPLTIIYRVNAGRLPADHWTLGPEGGGRAVGEACHMVDCLTALTGSPMTAMQAVAGRPSAPPAEDVIASFEYQDGSTATLVYTASGSSEVGKEWIEVHCDGHTYRVDDFRRLEVDGKTVGPVLNAPDKGHAAALARFAELVQGKAAAPVSLESLEATTRATFRMRDALAQRPADG